MDGQRGVFAFGRVSRVIDVGVPSRRAPRSTAESLETSTTAGAVGAIPDAFAIGVQCDT